jgi:hypothetical protein
VFADVSVQWSRPMEGYLAIVRAQERSVLDRRLLGSDYSMWAPSDGVAGSRAPTNLTAGGSLPRIEPSNVNAILSADSLGLLGLR